MSTLVGNYNLVFNSGGAYVAGPTLANTFRRYKNGTENAERALLFGTKETSFPIGYGGEAAIAPIRAGGLTARFLNAEIEQTSAPLVPALPMSASLSASGDITSATLALIVNLQAALSASGDITSAQLAIILNLAATISASGEITSAPLGNILNMAAALSASGEISTATLTTLINLSATISNSEAGTITYEGIAQAVLDAMLAEHNDAGSVGEALNNVGASGNPWASALSSNNTAGTFGERIQKLLTTAKFLGLK